MSERREPHATGPALRPATEADAHCLAALAIQVWLHTYATNGIRSSIARYVLSEFTPERFVQRVGTPGSHVVVAEVARHLVGYAWVQLGNHCRPAPGAGAELVNLYMQAHFAGTGIGTRLLHAAEQLAADHHADPLWLTVNAGNDRAIAFYAHNGYRNVGIDHFELDGERHENRVLVQAAP